MFGALFETLVHGELRRRLAVESPGTPLWFWSAHGVAEVDFVVEAGARFQLIEVKVSTQSGSDALRGFAAFAASYGEKSVARRTLVCRAPAPYATGVVVGIGV